jgi:uncharacterized protein YdiU (UPF0061 family)
MDAYDPGQVYSAIDRGGRYAFCNQPAIAQWNLARLAETLLAGIDPDPQRAVQMASEVIEGFVSRYEAHWLGGFRVKVGLTQPREPDRNLVESLLEAMAAGKADFTLTFRGLCRAAEDPSADAQVRVLFREPALYDAWAVGWRERLREEPVSGTERARLMRSVNPALIPRNHRVEQALDAAVRAGDLREFQSLHRALSDPFNAAREQTRDALPPAPGEEIVNTFCGT